MRRFRPSTSGIALPPPFDLLAVGEMIDVAMRAGNFFVHSELRLAFIAAQAETIPWEIYQGRLLDAAQTRLTKTLLSWRAILADETHTSGEPLIAVRLDVHARQIHVTRGLLAYVWEGYDSGGGVMESRETIKWTRELVGTIALAEFGDLESLRDELICTIWQAVVGTSRLPLHSVEAPLPAFVFGQLHYVFRADAGERPWTEWRAFLAGSLQSPLAWREKVKLVEFILRHVSANELADVCRILASTAPEIGQDLPRLMRSLFNEISLSPHTGFIDNALRLVDEWTALAPLRVIAQVDFLSWLLRQLCAHLTAYDLVTFHHRGANYPDALLLDAALQAMLRRIDTHPALFEGDDWSTTLRRRALRHACLLRRHYEGHLVPDQPTSPGENARVMPPSHPRLSDEQLLQPLKRRRRLFENDALADLLSADARRILALSLQDLQQPSEYAELGVGLFIDRPLGYAKTPIEPDLTPILAHGAFSPSLAKRRMAELTQLAAELGLPPLSLYSGGEGPGVRGCESPGLHTSNSSDASSPHPGPLPLSTGGEGASLPHRELAECPRPVAALVDVRKVADDFVIRRTLPGGMRELLSRFDWQELLARYRLRFLANSQVRLCAHVYPARSEELCQASEPEAQARDFASSLACASGSGKDGSYVAAQSMSSANGPVLALFDNQMRRRVEMRVDASEGYAKRAGLEVPRAGLVVAQVWEDTDDGNTLVAKACEVRIKAKD